MSLKKEQIGRGGRDGGAWRKWAKTQLQRFLRRQAKKDPEGAPRRNRDVYKGYD